MEFPNVEGTDPFVDEVSNIRQQYYKNIEETVDKYEDTVSKITEEYRRRLKEYTRGLLLQEHKTRGVRIASLEISNKEVVKDLIYERFGFFIDGIQLNQEEFKRELNNLANDIEDVYVKRKDN